VNSLGLLLLFLVWFFGFLLPAVLFFRKLSREAKPPAKYGARRGSKKGGDDALGRGR
jgi:hypothetical protein